MYGSRYNKGKPGIAISKQIENTKSYKITRSAHGLTVRFRPKKPQICHPFKTKWIGKKLIYNCPLVITSVQNATDQFGSVGLGGLEYLLNTPNHVL